MSLIAIITARGGSKRIPRKNIKNFMGKPMIAYAISAALKAGIFDEIMVSTEDAEIADIARQYGARVPFLRSAKTANDTATTFDVLDEVITEYKKQGKNYDTLCCIYPCVPFLKPETLQRAWLQLQQHGWDAVIPVCQYPTPIEWAMKIENGLLYLNDRQAKNMRSQDLTPKYFDVGMFYFCKTDKMYQYRSLVAEHTGAYVLDEMQCQDIDNETDWKMAELKYKLLHYEK